MRIAHLLTSGDVAGGQVIALRLGRAAAAAGHDVMFVAPSDGVLVAEASRQGFATELVDVGRSYRLRGASHLAQILRRRHVDLLHTHVHAAAASLGRSAARLAGAHVVSHLHIENHFRRRRLARAPLVTLDNLTARLCARLLAVSDATRASFERQGFPARLMETVHNGVDVAGLQRGERHGLRRQLAISAESIVLVHIGRLAPVKGQLELLEAAAGLTSERELRIVVIGKDLESGGVFESRLRAVAAGNGLADAVSFVGFLERAAYALAEADVLVLPSWIEGLPLVVLEAMAHGLPVVASAVGGTPEAVVDGETGLLVEPRDVPGLRAALQRVVADEGLRRRLGDAGRERARARFDAAAMERRVLEVYDEVGGR